MESTAITEHLAWCELRALRPSYIKEIGSTLTRVTRQLGKPLHEATAADLTNWWATLKVGAGCRIAYAAHLSGFFRWLVLEERRDDDPTIRLIRPRAPRGLPRPIDDVSLRRAIGAAGQPVRTWLALAAYMGLRACEIAAVCREDVRADLGVLIIRDGKGGKQRTVPLHAEVLACLENGPTSGPLFIRRTKDGPVSPNGVSQRANRFLRSIGLPHTLHQLRHWFGTNVYRNSSDLRLTQELMGHSSPTTTARYAAWAPEKAAAIIDSLDLSA